MNNFHSLNFWPWVQKNNRWEKVNNLHQLEFEISTFSNHKNTQGYDEKIISSKTHNTHTPLGIFVIEKCSNPKL